MPGRCIKEYLKVLKLAAEACEDTTVIGEYSPGPPTCRAASLTSQLGPTDASQTSMGAGEPSSWA